MFPRKSDSLEEETKMVGPTMFPWEKLSLGEAN